MNNQHNAPWTARRVFDMVKTPILLILLLMLVWFAWKWGTAALDTEINADPDCVTEQLAELPTKKVTVTVLNASPRRGAASATAGTLKNLGFVISSIGNADEDLKVPVTVIKGADAKAPEVLLVKQFFPKAKVEGDGRRSGNVDVLLGLDVASAAMNANAKPVIAVKGSSVCLAPLATPTPKG